MPATPPSTSDYVRFHAQHRPDSIAVIQDGREIDYATFCRDVGRFTRALREFGLPRGSTVAVAYEGLYVHWLLLLACERLGWATASFLATEQDSLPRLLAHVQLVLCSRRPPQAVTVRWHRTTRKWVEGVYSSPDAAWETAAAAAPMGMDEPQRIRRSSGTTGAFKMMVGTRAVEEQRIRVNLAIAGFTPRSRFLGTTPFTVATTYTRATTCLRLGATYIGSGSDVARELVRHRPSHAWLLQFQMKALLGSLPGSFRKPEDFTVLTGAGMVPQGLRQELLERVASRVLYTYSSNEAGTLAMVGADDVCILLPGAQAEVIDERGAPVAPGQVGQLKVKAPHMVSGYLDDTEATAQAFRDGWFLTGDVGTMPAPGRFKLMGRIDDVLNVGGRKIPPAAIEALLEWRAEFADVGVTMHVDSEGVEWVCIAVVPRNRMSPQEAAAWIGKRLPRDLGKIQVKLVSGIPRTPETGKIRRGELKKIFSPK